MKPFPFDSFLQKMISLIPDYKPGFANLDRSVRNQVIKSIGIQKGG